MVEGVEEPLDVRVDDPPSPHLHRLRPGALQRPVGVAPGVRCPRRRSPSRPPAPMPPSLQKVPSGGLPCFVGTTRHSDSPSLGPPRFVGGGWTPVPDPVDGRGDDGASHAPGEPPAQTRCAPTPVGPPCRAVTARRRGLPPSERRRLPQLLCLQGSITPPVCSRSTRPSPGHRGPRKTLFRLRAGSARREWAPAGLRHEGS